VPLLFGLCGMRSNARPQQHERRDARTNMTRNEIIDKTLKEMGPLEPENEPPYSEEPDYEESIIAELLSKLPDTDIKTCDDFKHLNVECCDLCHTSYPQYKMHLVDLPDGGKAWICYPVRRAIISGGA
jgi:hypothetical protein